MAMSVRAYIYASYFGLLALACFLGTAAYLWLRGPLAGIASRLARPHAQGLRRGLPTTLVLAALVGFFSVSFSQESCSSTPYQYMLAHPETITRVGQEETSRTLMWLSGTVYVWGVLVLLSLLRRPAPPPSQGKQIPSRGVDDSS